MKIILRPYSLRRLYLITQCQEFIPFYTENTLKTSIFDIKNIFYSRLHALKSDI